MPTSRDERIRARAYEISQREGRSEGRRDDHWAEATREIDQEDSAEQLDEGRREAEQQADVAEPGTTDQLPRWEGPPENRPRGYLPAIDDPARDRDAAGESLRDPAKSDLSDAFKTKQSSRRR
jgi:hypothetical protein